MLFFTKTLRGECRKIVGQAKRFPTLIKETMDHAESFLEPLEFSGRAYGSLYKFEKKFKQALQVESWKQSKGKNSCLKEITSEKISAIHAIATDDRGGWGELERFDYAEHTLENLLHLVKVFFGNFLNIELFHFNPNYINV